MIRPRPKRMRVPERPCVKNLVRDPFSKALNIRCITAETQGPRSVQLHEFFGTVCLHENEKGTLVDKDPGKIISKKRVSNAVLPMTLSQCARPLPVCGVLPSRIQNKILESNWRRPQAEQPQERALRGKALPRSGWQPCSSPEFFAQSRPERTHPSSAAHRT